MKQLLGSHCLGSKNDDFDRKSRTMLHGGVEGCCGPREAEGQSEMITAS